MAGQCFADNIQTFSGSTDVKSYIRNFETRCLIEKLTETQKYRLLASKLHGLAFDQFSLNQAQLQDYKSLKEFLIKTYEIKQKKATLYASLFSDYQKDLESIDEYCLRLTFKLNDASIANFNSQTEAGQIYLFGYIAQTMKASTKEKISPLFDPQTLEELLAQVRVIEAETSNTMQQSVSHQDNSLSSYETPRTNLNTPKRVQFYSPRNLSFESNRNQLKHNHQRYERNERFQPYKTRQQNNSSLSNYTHSTPNISGNCTEYPRSPKNFMNKYLEWKPPNKQSFHKQN